MIRMTWIRVEGVGVLRSFLPSFVSPSFLPSLIPFCLGIPSFLRGFSIRSLLSCLLPFLLLPSFLPSFLSSFPFRSFVSSSFLFCFLFFSFLPSFLSPGIPSFPPCLRRDLPSKKKDRKNTPSPSKSLPMVSFRFLPAKAYCCVGALRPTCIALVRGAPYPGRPPSDPFSQSLRQ